jgi:hypothetical protein
VSSSASRQENLEITCVKKTNRAGLHERVHSVGGITATGRPWHLSQQAAIEAIESGARVFYIAVHGKAVLVIIGVARNGEKYLKTLADNAHPNSLLGLAECA